MFESLQSILRLDEIQLDGKSIHVCEEEDQMGTFLLHHFVHSAVKSNKKILLICFEHSFGHFNGVGLKFGLNLLKLRESGTLRFFDGFQSVSEALDDQDNFKYLSKKLMSFLDENLDENSVIILDKVSILQSLGLDTKSAVELCLALQLKALTTKSVLVTRSRANSSLDVDLEDFSVDDPSDQISSFLAQSAFLNIVVRPLPTGKSLSVTGNLHFKSRAETAIHRFQYLLEEKDVKIFAKGTSNAVL